MSDKRSSLDLSDEALVEDLVTKIGIHRLMAATARIAGSAADGYDMTDTASEALWVPFRGTMARLPIDDIVMIEADRDYVRVHDPDQTYLLRATLSQFAGQLGDRFLRIHRSSIVARARVTALRHTGKGRWAVVIDTGREVSIGRTYLEGVRALLDRRIVLTS